ncbi:HAD family hydrolase [Roseibium sp.]|uniref:HAD family hydrolase n=1 Tax=Roseibium sp. TaxID=1936156 RepID=UPI003A973912
MPHSIKTLGFDADDTLWHNERFFQLTETRFTELLSDHAEGDHLRQRLLAAERRNVGHYGYGIRGFTLSMIETAIEVTGGNVPGHVIGEILEAGRAMLSHPVEPLPHVEATLKVVSTEFQLVLITKGDLFDQERKVAESGLANYFKAVEVVSEKDDATYARIFSRHGAGADKAMMIGNSMKSDILPALSAGAHGVHVPYEITWAMEKADAPSSTERFHRLAHLGELTDLLAQIG